MRSVLFSMCAMLLAVYAFDVPSKAAPGGKASTQAQAQPKADAEEEDGAVFSFLLEHNLGRDGGFRPRGSVDLLFGQGKVNTNAVRFADAELSSAEAAQFQKLLSSGGFYSVRVVQPRRDGRQIAAPITSSVPACSLLSSNYRELFTFHVDVHGAVVALDYKTPISERDCPANAKTGESLKLHPKGKISLGRAGERPKDIHRSFSFAAPTADGEQQPQQQQPQQQQQQGQAADGKPQEQPQSFLQKYWLYLVIGAVVLLQLTAAAPAGPAGGGGA